MKTSEEILKFWKDQHDRMPYATITLHAIFLHLQAVCLENERLKATLAEGNSQDARVAKLESVVNAIQSTKKWKSFPTRQNWEEILKLCKDASTQSV